MTTSGTVSIRRAAARGQADHGWLRSAHTFSFADYYDPAHMGFRNLRVINEDRVAPGRGFGTHPHQDMEIVSYVLEGSLEHRDSMGNGSTIRPGEVQRMSAGTGVRHSEFNGSASDPVHFLQIWILPERKGMPPSYDQRMFAVDDRRDRLRRVLDREGREGAMTIHADVAISSGVLAAGVRVEHVVAPGRHAWLQLCRGSVDLDLLPGSERVGTLAAGDGVAISRAGALAIQAGSEGAELLVFDLP
ncbi:pirin family protein [Nannocystaceae bacterium ST9]